MKTYIPAIPAFREWLQIHQLTPSGFARRYNIDDRVMRKIVTGEKKNMTVEMADVIERATRGIVHMRLWIPVPKD